LRASLLRAENVSLVLKDKRAKVEDAAGSVAKRVPLASFPAADLASTRRSEALMGLAALRPERFPNARLAAALVIAATGGWTFTKLGLPLPWMLGSMAFCTAAALLQAPIAAPPMIRPPVTAVIGVMLGATFAPSVLDHILLWLPTIAFLLAYLLVCVSLFESPWFSMGWLLACGVLGCLVGHFMRLPAKYLLGPMLVSALVHVAGVSEFVPPIEIVNAAQIVFGATIGCRFVGSAPGKILRVLGLSVGATLIMLVVTVLFAAMVGRTTGVRLSAILLAYSPGGFAEMSLVALAMNLEVAFVAAHHFMRILLVVLIARPLYAKLSRWW
jgi:membrane AbrB-like protein